MMGITTLCTKCRFFKSSIEEPDEVDRCIAFPDGIPPMILAGEELHVQPLEGQQGETVFEKRDDVDQETVDAVVDNWNFFRAAIMSEASPDPSVHRGYPVSPVPSHSIPLNEPSREGRNHPGTVEPEWHPVHFEPPWEQISIEVPGLPDDGQELLELMVSLLYCDDWRLDWMDRGVDWWAAQTPLSISVSRPGLLYGDPTIKMTMQVPIVEDITVTNAEGEALASRLNGSAPGRAVVFDPVRKRLFSSVTFYAHTGNRSVLETRLLGLLVMMAYIEAVELSDDDGITAQLAGRSPRVRTGDRLGIEPDQMLELIDDSVIPRGLDESAWGSVDFEMAHQWFREHDWLSLGTDGTCTTVEFPFGENGGMYRTTVDAVSAAGSMEEAVATHVKFAIMVADDDDMATTLFTMSQHRHEVLGSGLLMELWLPADFDDPYEAANILNLMEATEATSVPAWGAWTVSDDSLKKVKWVSFFPNLAHRFGYIGAQAMHAMVRSFWVRRWYFREGHLL